jgi:hypothetical protein
MSQSKSAIDYLIECLGKFAYYDGKIGYISATETDRELELIIANPDNYREQFILKLNVQQKSQSNETDNKDSSIHFDSKLGFQNNSSSVPGPIVQSSDHLEEWV